MTVSLQTEPVTIMAAINGAIASTLGVLTITDVISADVAGGIGAALGAWILVGALLFVRPNVASPLTQENLAKELAEAQAKAVSEKGTKPGS